MLPNTEWLLLGVVGMYVYDATLLLYHNEVVFFERRDGRWSFSVGTEFELAGRHVYVPPLFAPTRALLRLRWSSQKEPGNPAPLHGLRAWRAGVTATTLPVLVVALLFAAMPAVLAGNVYGLLGWMIALYAAIGAAVWRVWRMRRITGLAGKTFSGMASDALLCAPYALNLVRKQGARAAERFDLFAVAHALLDADERRRLGDAIRTRLQRQLDIEEAGSDRQQQLQTYLQQIEGALA
ncbi:hypothetical protein [Luteibacter sp. 9133]|uniref:hypothetical protein n=1 Tax=Luteibacter sp. 9133 TaxID=1500891 RepID=UPI0005BA0672|nr:hypothetical protein [Luteibacter sp. 9133]